ncbi:hypothetical protein IG631_11169 [Alternaria alternata]|nr:hypothetical protein IG631_11169 [Alternaria alternata]
MARYEVREMEKDLVLLHVAGHLSTQTQLVASGHENEQDAPYASARFISSDRTLLVGSEALESGQPHRAEGDPQRLFVTGHLSPAIS